MKTHSSFDVLFCIVPHHLLELHSIHKHTLFMHYTACTYYTVRLPQQNQPIKSATQSVCIFIEQIGSRVQSKYFKFDFVTSFHFFSLFFLPLFWLKFLMVFHLHELILYFGWSWIPLTELIFKNADETKCCT